MLRIAMISKINTNKAQTPVMMPEVSKNGTLFSE
jgi:hypothetical protein